MQWKDFTANSSCQAHPQGRDQIQINHSGNLINISSNLINNIPLFWPDISTGTPSLLPTHQRQGEHTRLLVITWYIPEKSLDKHKTYSRARLRAKQFKYFFLIMGYLKTNINLLEICDFLQELTISPKDNMWEMPPSCHLEKKNLRRVHP